jgi:competence protein ComFC
LICHQCQHIFLSPNFYQREVSLEDGTIFKVFSFYKYEEIKELINLKYEPIGNQIFEILSNLSMKAFIQNFDYEYDVSIVPIDDSIKSNYSHTAVLAKQMNYQNKKVKYGRLRANKHIKYAGKSLEFRQNNSRNLKCTISKSDIILIDDIITTGSTMSQAYQECRGNDNNVLFGLVLCDARE